MRQLCLEKWEGTSVEEMLEKAQSWLGSGGVWLLGEAPTHIVFRPCDTFTVDVVLPLQRIILFSPAAEVRMEKPAGAHEGIVRAIRHVDAGQEQRFVRESSYLLRAEYGGERLRYAEYFRQEHDGRLVLDCGRLCGVAGGGA